MPSDWRIACTAPWTALYVEGRRSLQLSEEERDRIADTLRLAESLGGEAITIPSADRRIADDVIGYAHANNVTQIIIGKSTRSRWFEILHGSVVHDLVRRSGNISVHVIAGDAVAGEPIPKKTVRTAEGAESLDPRPYLIALVAVAVALGVGVAIQPWLGIENVDLVFLTAVVGVAVRYGLWPSLVASVAASLCYNFFFLPPIYTFTIADPTNVAAFFFFIVMAVIVSNVAARVRTQAVAAMARARTTESLYAFSRKLAGTGTLDDVLWATAYQTALMLKVRVVLLLPENGSIAVKAGYPPEDTLDAADLAAANVGLGERPAGGTRFGYAARRQAAVPADAHRPRRHRGRRHRQRQAGAASDAGSAAAARCIDGSGGARHRARPPGRGYGPGQANGRDGSSALRAADLDLARSQDAARGGSWVGGHASGSCRQAHRSREGRSAGDDHRRSPSGSIASSRTCST